MIRSRNLTFGWAGCILLALTLGACDEPSALGPTDRAPEVEITTPFLDVVGMSAMGIVPMACRTDEPIVGTGTVTAGGGNIMAGPHRVDVPAGAVTTATEITMIVPPSEYMVIDMRANGREHFEFAAPISISLDYSECDEALLSEGDPSAWYIADGSGLPVEEMPVVEVIDGSRVTFSTDHFSVYMLAN